MNKLFIFILLTFSLWGNAQNKKVCNENDLYSLDETAVKNAAKSDTKNPKTLPLWPKGKDSLQTYIDLNLDLHAFNLSKQTYRYNMVVLINCKGEVVSVKEISKGAQDSKEKTEIGIKIENMLEGMTGWIPATVKKDIPVDCYTKLIFNINNEGKKVVYKTE
ncbi:hypothetical protein FLAV_01585 [Flavobacteriales bacterium]|nr:hypothetical protein [Flavobacteriales bacterium]MCL4815994.1 hypothetical protein [Flavobacteriales bacterium]WKZ74324.1 MAG: hypothetical protein QY303_09235 [Vicingaceae bacterium]CAG0977525.1 hypothetical protein FLAV_01585 [Flavobacteriales bacterium]